MTPPQVKTWSQCGPTPVARVRGRSRRRDSGAALTCYKPDHRSRLIYRPRRNDGHRDGRKSFSWRVYQDLLIAAHQQLGAPIVLVRSLLRRGWLSNVAFITPDHLVQTVRRGLRHIQSRSHLMVGCLAETGLTVRAT
jgi:hypothetical protein